MIGTLGVVRTRPGHPYTEEEEVLLQNIASRAAMAITTNRLYEELQQSYNQLEVKVMERTSELNKTMSVLAEEQQRFRDVLDMLPSYVALLTPDYRFAFVNQEFKKRFGDCGDRTLLQIPVQPGRTM